MTPECHRNVVASHLTQVWVTSALSDALPLSAQQIAASNRSLYAGPSDVVIVIVMHQHGQPVSPQKTANAPGME
jgi:hypothetical protein